MDFYTHLNYSLGNEDWQVENQALRVAPDDAIICVTASGDRPLHLLMTECAEVISIDMNYIQTYLLELKIAALRQFDYEKYLQFLGCETTRDRFAMFKELKKHLSSEAVNYWTNHKKMIQRGIIFQGRVERLTRFSAKIFNLIHPKKIQTLFSFTDIGAQREFLHKYWEKAVWHKIFSFMLNPNISKFFFQDPGLNSYTEYAASPGNYIYQKMITYLENHLARRSALLQLLFTGSLTTDAYFPYLTVEGYHKIRSNTEKLQYHTADIIDYLDQHPNHFNGFSLSDIASYMPQAVFEKLLQNMYSAAKPGARFCLREFISKRLIPDDLQAVLHRNKALENKLENEESNFVYRFIAGEIQK